MQSFCKKCCLPDNNTNLVNRCGCTGIRSMIHQTCLKSIRTDNTKKSKRFFSCGYCKRLYKDTENYVVINKDQIRKSIEPGNSVCAAILMYYLLLVICSISYGSWLSTQNESYRGQTLSEKVGISVGLTLSSFGFSYIIYDIISSFIQWVSKRTSKKDIENNDDRVSKSTLSKIEMLIVPLVFTISIITYFYLPREWKDFISSEMEVFLFIGLLGNILSAKFFLVQYRKYINAKMWKILKNNYMSENFVFPLDKQ